MCYIFLFAGLTLNAGGVPIENGDKGCDGPELFAGARDGDGIFYLNRPEPIEKSGFKKINASKRQQIYSRLLAFMSVYPGGLLPRVSRSRGWPRRSRSLEQLALTHSWARRR
jgi:hypothetical protein